MGGWEKMMNYIICYIYLLLLNVWEKGVFFLGKLLFLIKGGFLFNCFDISYQFIDFMNWF